MYNVIVADRLSDLIEGVNIARQHGWECQGGLTTWRSRPAKRKYAQAMILPYPKEGEIWITADQIVGQMEKYETITG